MEAERYRFFLAAQDVFKQNKSPKHKNKDLLISASYFEIYGSKVSEKISRIFDMLHFPGLGISGFMALNYGQGTLGTCENCNCKCCYVLRKVHPSRTQKECIFPLCKTLTFYCSCES